MSGLLSAFPGAPAAPQSWRAAADLILERLDREDTERAAAPPRYPWAPPASGFVPPRAADLPFPEPLNDDQRIDNALWLLDNNPGGTALRSDNASTDSINALGPENLFGLIGSASAQGRGRGGRSNLTNHQQTILELYNLYHRHLSSLESNNPFLTTVHPPGYIPPLEELNLLVRATMEAQQRMERGETPRPPGYIEPMPRRGGETEYTTIGRAAHRDHAARREQEGYETNVPVAGGWADAVRDFGPSAHVEEHKPNNQSAIRRGEIQGERYGRGYQAEHRKPTTWSVDVYDIIEWLKRYLGDR